MSQIKILFLFVCVSLSSCTTKPLRSPLKKSMPEGFQNKVIVLGTPHLSGRKEFKPAQLDSLVLKLSDWKPTQICVESRHPVEINQMAKFEPFDLGVKKILGQFDKYKVDLSKKENKKPKYSFAKASSLQKSELKKDKLDAFKIIKLSLISYDFPTALLYWSKLSDSERKSMRLSNKSKESLNKWFQSSNEINSLAVRLAKKLGLKSICSMDSQISAAPVLAADEKEIEALFSSPNVKKFRESQFFKEMLEAEKKAFAGGDLLSLYSYLNSPKINYKDETQWEWLYDDPTNTGLNRSRFIAWDARNAQMAKNIISASQTRNKERVLVIVGASHKSIVERMLRATNSISVEEAFLQ